MWCIQHFFTYAEALECGSSLPHSKQGHYGHAQVAVALIPPWRYPPPTKCTTSSLSPGWITVSSQRLLGIIRRFNSTATRSAGAFIHWMNFVRLSPAGTSRISPFKQMLTNGGLQGLQLMALLGQIRSPHDAGARLGHDVLATVHPDDVAGHPIRALTH